MPKTVIITGGCRGIGLAISMRFAKEGCQVIAIGRKSEAECASVLSQIRDLGLDPFYIQADVSASEDRKRAVDLTVSRFGRIDILVNNAGIAPKERASILEMTEESWDEVLDTNTKANMFMTQLVANAMIKQEVVGSRRGTIINVSSCSAEVSSPNRAQYCVSKAGISMLTKVYADALAPYGIIVNEIRPGVIRSDMTFTVEAKYNKLIAEGAFPIARWGEGEDVASAVFAFSSDDFLYTTGNYIDVDGGFHIKRL
ncbi:MAG: 3-ketoacyl-ACP reductase [Sphaerochaetaceae bacterium]|nr:3-ketoacyl-ACP reductase [Sphaerochaetaceae bacterium]